ncbi:hypothetical protein GQ55_9G423500 [Panicum hallii var. hallii]|uniref:Uncharacterized protein n=1 Tax=Panicum hallii var. hallii TaxID=1504633 RepID=A0A2T7CAR5_9POAL|nr:hypothetical protein GQ55_9G423500 [Panicum hallii var. hallii]
MASSPTERGDTTRPSTWRMRPTRGPREAVTCRACLQRWDRGGLRPGEVVNVQTRTAAAGVGGSNRLAGPGQPHTVLAAASDPVPIPSSTSGFPKSNPPPPPWSWSPPTTSLPPPETPPPISISGHTAARREID